MIKEVEFGNPNVLGWRLEGKVEEAEYEAIINSLKKRMETSNSVSIYMEVPEMPGITFQVVMESLKFGFAHLKAFLKSIDKVAMVTNKEWLQKYTAIESRLLPGIEEKAFSFDDIEIAKKWVRED